MLKTRVKCSSIMPFTVLYFFHCLFSVNYSKYFLVNLTVIVLFPLQHLKDKHHSIFIQFILLYDRCMIFLYYHHRYFVLFSKTTLWGHQPNKKPSYMFLRVAYLFFRLSFQIDKFLNRFSAFRCQEGRRKKIRNINIKPIKD